MLLSDSSVWIVKTHDVIFAKLLTALYFDYDNTLDAGIDGAVKNTGRFIGRFVEADDRSPITIDDFAVTILCSLR